MGTIVLSSFSDDDGVLYKQLMDQLKQYPLDLKDKAQRKASDWFGGKRYSADRAGYENHLDGYLLTSRGQYRHISLFYIPKRFRYDLPVYKLVWHQSQWENQEEVVETFRHYVGKSKSHEIFFVWRMERLDLWIDTGFSFDVLKRSIYKSKISSREIIKSNLKSYYWGSPASKTRLMAYEKSVDPKRIDVSLMKTGSMGTRIELRLLKDRVPIQTYSEYKRLSELRLFDSVRNFFMSKEAWKELSDEMTGLRLIKLLKFQDLVHKDGYSCAMKEMNKDHNFERTLGKHISLHAKSYDFSEIWMRKVSERIVAGFDIDAYFDVGPNVQTELRLPKIRFFYDNGLTIQ